MNTTLFERDSIAIQLEKEYEIQILTMLISTDDKERQKIILNHLCLDMFTYPLHRDIFKAVQELQKLDKEIEIGNLCEVLTYENQKMFAIELNKEYITSANYKYYLEKVINAYIGKLLKECDSFEGYKKIEKLKNKYSLKNKIVPISHMPEELICEYYNKWGNYVRTYYPQIDKVIGSLQGGDIFILAGATGIGKTCMMLNLIHNMEEKGHKVLLFSLEMSLKQLQNRLISAKTNINSDKIRKFNMTEFELKAYSEYALSEKFKDLKIDVCTEFNITTEEIKETILESDADVVFIDYLGLIKSTISGNTYEKVSEISRNLKVIANETNKPIVVLHQLNRIAAERKDKRPKLSDLRDSGKIEQDADTICFVYRDAYYNTASDKTKLQFIVAKSRHTEGTKVIDLDYDASKQIIRDKIGEYMERSKQCNLNI